MASAAANPYSPKRQIQVVVNDDTAGHLLAQMLHPLTDGSSTKIHVGEGPDQENILLINPALAEARTKFSLIYNHPMGIGQRPDHHEAEIMPRIAVLATWITQPYNQRNATLLQDESLSENWITRNSRLPIDRSLPWF